MSTEHIPEDDAVIRDSLKDIQKKEQEILQDEQAILRDEERIREAEAHEHHEFDIQIDRDHYTVREHHLTGAQIRRVPSAPIGPDRDLFEVVPGGSDRKISDAEVVEMRNGLRFFTAPGHINPGMEGPRRER